MLFNSLPYIFGFLPITLLVFFAAGRLGSRLAAAWLVVASLAFYGWWNPAYLALLLGSIAWNFGAALGLLRCPLGGAARRWVLGVAIAGDLALLGVFKYADFVLRSAAALTGEDLGTLGILLPLGISFFTFTQIAFLVDTARGEVREVDPINYALFVTFFPHLLAGPVLHHREMMPQFERPSTYRPRAENLSVGLTIFILGLFKKVVLADGVAPYASPLFDAAGAGAHPGFADAWIGALAYTFQLYYDFSGYTDMAIGGARLFGIVLPENFRSPYRSVSLIDFWRRWHMTLSRFLRDYLYVPLGGNRHGPARRHLNLLVTMLLGGLWHGAAWTFVLWGGFHGLGLIVNHGWRALLRRVGIAPGRFGPAGRIAGVALTFMVVVVGWVFFRAESVDAATRILAGMAGLNPDAPPIYRGLAQEIWLAFLLSVTFLAPTTQDFVGRFQPHLIGGADDTGWSWGWWRPDLRWAMVLVVALVAALSQMSDISPFLYYRF
ncbi:MAG TPA: MBOAT family protein [Stellaceae bacterium]|nr:MBOAT family protein [Stellaceae bacterium]